MTESTVIGIVAAIIGALTVACVTGVIGYAIKTTLSQYVKREEFVQLKQRLDQLEKQQETRVTQADLVRLQERFDALKSLIKTKL